MGIAALILSTHTSQGEESSAPTQQNKSTPSQLHGSLLAQSMLAIPGPPALLIQDSLLSLPPQILLALSIYTTTSHIIQSALLPTPSPQQDPTSLTPSSPAPPPLHPPPSPPHPSSPSRNASPLSCHPTSPNSAIAGPVVSSLGTGL